MADDVLPDQDSPFGKRVRQRVRDEVVIWFSTVGADGTPQPNPVWFVWQDNGFLIYNRNDANRLTHIRHRPRVSLHFDSDGQGSDIVVFTGRARRLTDAPPPHGQPPYLAKYGNGMTRISGSPETFSQDYPVAVHIDVERVRGY